MAEDKLAEGARRFKEKMNAGAYKEAAKIKSDLGLPNSMLQDAVKSAYDANMKKGDYSLAAELASGCQRIWSGRRPSRLSIRA